MNTQIFVGLAVVVIVALLALAGSFGNMFGIFTSYTTLQADDITDTSLTFKVVASSTMNIKQVVSDAGGRFTTDTMIQGNADLPTSAAVCSKWGGAYSESQGVCDFGPNQIDSLPANIYVKTNSLKMKEAQVDFADIRSGSIRLTLPSPQQMGCTQAMLDNDQCIGSVSGSITFGMTSQPTEVCGNGICAGSEDQVSCPDDCGSPPGPPEPPEPKGFLDALAGFFTSFMATLSDGFSSFVGFIASLFGG